jgi:hypothetical protein
VFKAENLKCARQIRHFEELAIEKKPDELKEYAWGIYLNFIAPGCLYEISCTSIQRKYIQLRLGCPIKTMFDGIKESTMLVLKLEHKTFCAHLTQKTLKDRLRGEHSGSSTPKKTSFLSKIF